MREPSTPPDAAEPAADEPAWARNRRLRLAELEAANARGEQLAERYDRGMPPQRYAVVGHASMKRRRLR
jgi:hypothetical protein